MLHDGEMKMPVVITNKHVIEGAKTGRFLLTKKDDAGQPRIGETFALEMPKFANAWMVHPDDYIDLCAMPLGPIIHHANGLGVEVFYAPLDISNIPSDEDIENMIGLENVTMVGYPNGLWDEVNNLPIFRKGIMASDYKQDWNGRAEFLIDAACFPGSSGSPVMLFDVGSYQDRRGMHAGASRYRLLGVLYAGPQYTAEGDIKIVNVPTQQKIVAQTDIPTNLGMCIKAGEIRRFEQLFLDVHLDEGR